MTETADRPAVELWTSAHGAPGFAAKRAAVLEDEGWSGMGIVDSQCLSGDVYIAAALAAAATTRLRIASAVTKPRDATSVGGRHRGCDGPGRERRTVRAGDRTR